MQGENDNAAPPQDDADETHHILRVEGQEGLPTYEQSIDVVPPAEGGEQEENNSTARFGRWRGWVEKRALERYPTGNDPNSRRQARQALQAQSSSPSHPPPSYLPPAHIPPTRISKPHTPLPPTDLCILPVPDEPHSTCPPTCSLTLFDGDLILLGTAEGLKSLNSQGARHVWTGLPVWNIRILSVFFTEEGQTPRGTVAVFCGGDGKKGGEVRVWKLESLVSLGRWSAMQDLSHGGIDLSVSSGKGKGKIRSHGNEERRDMGIAEAWAGDFVVLSVKDVLCMTTGSSKSMIVTPQVGPFNNNDPNHNGVNGGGGFGDRSGVSSVRSVGSGVRPNGTSGMTGGEIANEITRSNEQSDETPIIIAIGTKDLVFLFLGRSSFSSPIQFKTKKSFYLPSSPHHLSLLTLSTPLIIDHELDSEDLSLGIFVSFGSKACLIKVVDSTVTDLDLGKKGKEWGPVRWIGMRDEGEVGVFTRGNESFVFLSPIRIPFSAGGNVPLARAEWHEQPISICVRETESSSQERNEEIERFGMEGNEVGDEDGGRERRRMLRITATSSGILHTHKIDLFSEEYKGNSIPAALGTQARLLSNGWEGLRAVKGEMDEGMVAIVKKAPGDWRVVRSETMRKMG
ncbi:hypothetical protein M231_00609 [Tremella mesenterica]|uniref:Uncharacterized protein n=1 Tax=Tremella mesenterica TaxID=5217 RepID=A0A4Q1BVU0_TREME|nr:hypothetical protein M231_00609 [Tremella mesenterica]